MEACCNWFNQMLKNKGLKGLSVIAVNNTELNLRGFYLQARAMDFSEPKVYEGQSITQEGDYTSMAVMVRTPLDYCPRCGVKLSELIHKNLQDFDRLAKDHENLAKY